VFDMKEDHHKNVRNGVNFYGSFNSFVTFMLKYASQMNTMLSD
jgi:hypothetical protein